ncbi:MAG: iron-siderophore ABC transporter substrate-binding protein [Litorilinea sp.]
MLQKQLPTRRTSSVSILHIRLPRVAFLLVGAILLAGCIAAPTPGAPAATAPAASSTAAPASAAADEAAAECVSVTHARGATEICGVPQRIVTLEWTYTENLLALGIQPAGVADIEGYHNWVRIPVALDDTVPDVGTRQEPNLETLAALQPDLILASAFRVEQSYEELQAIAPTLVFDSYPTAEQGTQYDEMRRTFLTIAQVLDRTAQAEQVLADVEDTYAELRAQIADAGQADRPFVLAQAFGSDTVQVRLFTDNAMATQIVENLGLRNGWQDGFQTYGFTTVSMETLPELGDVSFFYVVQADNDVFQRDAIRPLWENLEFVRNGHDYPLGGDTWLFGGPLSAQLVAEIVTAVLLDSAD